jgi:hypothetical protein
VITRYRILQDKQDTGTREEQDIDYRDTGQQITGYGDGRI